MSAPTKLDMGPGGPGPEATFSSRELAATAVIDGTGVTADTTAATPADSARIEYTTPSPVELLLAGPKIPMADKVEPYKRARRAGLSQKVSYMVAETSLAALGTRDSTLDEVAAGIDERSSHAAIRDNVNTIGTIAQIRDEGSPALADSRVKEHVASRVVLFRVGAHHNSLNGKGPKGEARQAIERRTAAVTAEIVQEREMLEGAPIDPSADPALQAAMDAATIGFSMDTGNPYRRPAREVPDFRLDFREIGSEAVARRTKDLLDLPDAHYKMSAPLKKVQGI